MPLYCDLERYRFFFPAMDAIQSTFSEIYVLEIVEMLEDGLAHVEGFGATGTSGELFETFLDGLGKANG
jgi:hypothetical protein